MTPDLSVKRSEGLYIAKPRIFEILKAVKDFDVEKFVILDDEGGHRKMHANHVITKYDEGLTTDQAISAILILNS